MKQTMQGRVWQLVCAMPRRLASPKLGLLLIIAIFALALVAAFYPAKIVVGFARGIGQAFALDDLERIRALSFQERFESPLFLLLVAVLSLSLCFSLYFRVRAEIRRRRADAQPQVVALQPRSATVVAVEQELKRRGYRTRAAAAAGAWHIHGSKGGGGVWGSVLFHLGLLLVLVAVTLSTTASFRGSVKLTENEVFNARTDRYGAQQVGRWYTPSPQPLNFRLVRVDPDYDANGASTIASIVQPMWEGEKARFFTPTPVYISHGLHHDGVTIHQGREFGYAPQVMIDDATGKRLIGGYISLVTLTGPEKNSFADYVELKDKDARVEIELFPDAVYRNGVYLNRSGALKTPVLHVIVREQDKPVFDEFIPVTRDFTAGGYTVFFGGVRRWSQLEIVDEPAVPVLIAATLLGSLGLLLRLLSVRRRIVVTLPAAEGNYAVAFDVTGSSEKFQRAFEEELAGLRVALAQRLAGEPVGGNPPLAQLSNG